MEEKCPLNLTGKYLLIIEDNKDIQNVLKTALEIEGYLIFTANNGKEGLEQLSKMPIPCMVLLDLMMPIMNGWEFADEISRDIIYSSIPIVVVSAFNDKNFNTEKNNYIQKPIDLDALLKTISKHCK
ncbi:MAG: response regulator [Bacteriovorax sp.]|nr:response regulator [Bacteriovorax sp.]